MPDNQGTGVLTLSVYGSIRRFVVTISSSGICLLIAMLQRDLNVSMWRYVSAFGIAAIGCLAAAVQVWTYPYPRGLFLSQTRLLIGLVFILATLIGCEAIYANVGAGSAPERTKKHIRWVLNFVTTLIAIWAMKYILLTIVTSTAILDCMTATIDSPCNITTSDMDRDKQAIVDKALKGYTFHKSKN